MFIKRSPRCLLAAGILVCGTTVWADSITPSSFSTTLAVGGSVTIPKTVTVTMQSVAPVDVFFLMDTTGSMGGSLSDITANFGSIATTISGTHPNVFFGVGSYNDCVNGPGDCPAGTLDLAYTEHQDLTGNNAAVQTALGSLSAFGGGDGPESNLYGLWGTATMTSWRADSRRFLFWAGDVPGHDPRQGVTEAIATDALVDANVRTYGLSVGGGLGDQGERITTATGGALLTGGYTEISTLIQNALTTTLLNYSEVSLGVVGLGPGVGVTWVPPSHTGTFDRSTNRNFGFDVTFTGLTPGTHNFEVVAMVDGFIVARETDSITVTGGMVPEPSTFALIGGGLLGLVALRLRRR
jgi:hypothetical protein